MRVGSAGRDRKKDSSLATRGVKVRCESLYPIFPCSTILHGKRTGLVPAQSHPISR